MVGLGRGVEQGCAESIDSSWACAERQGADQLAVPRARRFHGEEAHNGFPALIHPLFDEVLQALVEQLPTLLGELFRFAARKELMEHGVEPISHGTHQADQRFGIHRVELVPPGGAPKRVVTAPLPKFNPVGELRLESHLLAGPDHRLATIEVESLNGQQQQVETLDAPSAETRAVGGCAGGWSFSHGCDDNEVSRRQDVSRVLRLSRSSLSQNSRSTETMGRPRKPIQRRSNGVYCVQLHLGGKRVMRSLGTRDIEIAHRRAAQAMEELEAAHKAKQEDETRWRDAEEFSSLLELFEVLDPQTAAEQYTGKRAQDDVAGAFLDKNTEALAQALLKREVPATWNDLIREVERIRRRKNLSPFSASWHRNVGIAIKQCPFELAEVTPEAIRKWIDQMQDAGLTGLFGIAASALGC